MAQASWGIVLTADEPASLVLANVGWHLATGAQEVHLYLDRPDDPVAKMLAPVPNVHVTSCDDLYWSDRRRGRPSAQTRRQLANTDHAMQRAQVDWLTHIDADEFLVQRRPLSEELAAIRELDCEIHFPVSERFYRAGDTEMSLFDGFLRRSTIHQPGFDTQIFGSNCKYLQRGLIGHAGGKSAAPTDSDFKLGIHSVFRGKRNKDARSKRFSSQSTCLYHFDGLTPLHWLIKLARYFSRIESGQFPKSRVSQLDAFIEHRTGLDTLMRFHDQLRCMPSDQIDRFRGFGLIEADGFDPSSQIEIALGHPVDLSRTSFDAELRTRFPELIDVVTDRT